MEKTILTCAVTGNITSRDHHPRLPITPSQIAQAALDAASAGAAIVHLHVRDPRTGKGSMQLELYEELVERIREKNEHVILNLTTGEGGRFIPSDEDPKRYGVGTTLCTPEKRVVHVEKIKPEICTLDLNTMWSGSAAVINPPKNLAVMAERIYAAGVKPEIEIFNTSDLHLMKFMIQKGLLQEPLMVQMVLGVRFGAPADTATMAYLASQLPPATLWSAFGIGAAEFPMVAQAFLLGGHVRVGMEDNIYIKKGKLCRDNAQLVEKAGGIIESLGGQLATPQEARALLRLGEPK